MKKCYQFLQQQGLGSRTTCLALLKQGRVTLNGQILTQHQTIEREQADDVWMIDGEIWAVIPEKIYIMLHKPPNTETSHQPSHYASVFSILPPILQNRGINAVGRLDADTTGLLILTNDGQAVHALTSPKRHVPKCYEVTLKHPASGALVEQLQQGVQLHGETGFFCAESPVLRSSTVLQMTIHQGKYHQVKRMIAACANRVSGLHRLSLGRLTLGDLPLGDWRYLTEAEVYELLT
ncbi:MAG: pseudouridine synthase [Neisseriaceae bacterium]|nr:pseudouridine synthase [Neisseriaceae bacterium]